MAPPPFALSDSIFHDLAHWLHLHPASADDLYSDPYTVQAVLRALPPLARQYVMRLVLLPADMPVPLDAFRLTLRRRQRAVDRHDAAVRALRALHVFHDPGTPTIDLDNVASSRHSANSPTCLHSGFAANLRLLLSNAVQPVLGTPIDESTEQLEVMDDFSASRLENILNYLVESGARRKPSGAIVPALQRARILEYQSGQLTMTSEGFHFLLKHSFPQLWVLLRAVIASNFSSDFGHAVHLLFMLAAASPGRLYSMDELNAAQRELLNDLNDLGIVMVDNEARTLRPTIVGVRLLSAGSHVGSDISAADLPNIAKSAGQMDIFVETNFRVYAYTSSGFQTNLLGLFTHLRYRLPGLVVAHLTRDAVRNALISGITAEQIIAYLNAHAHPRLKKGVIPPNVSDEIRLWEAEQHRIQSEPGTLLSDFQSQPAFERVVDFANDLSAILWQDSSRRQLVVDSENYDAVRQFIHRHGLQ